VDGRGGGQVGAHALDHAGEDAVDEADVAVVEADLDVVDGAGADDLGGLADLDAGQAARVKSASAEMPSPGAMAPPRNSPLAETTSKVVAVPMSTTMQGPAKRSKAATQLQMRSAPASEGLSMRTGRPVLTPGSTNMGRILKKRSQTWRSVPSMGGTTEEMAMPVISSPAMPPCSKRLRRRTPNSSMVRASGVVMRQVDGEEHED
jgi:hypothetical protein